MANKEPVNDKNEQLSDGQLSELDRALAAAQARKAKKQSAGDAKTATTVKTPEEREAEKVERERVKAEKKAAREAARAEKQAAREKEKAEKVAAREAKKAAREAARAARTPHMGKVEKAAERLPELSDEVTQVLEDLVNEYDLSTLTSLAAHIQHQVRVEATKASLNVKLEEGQTVSVIAGDPRYIGQVGTVTKVQRIRCYVQLPDTEKPVYLFTADVTPVTEAQVAVG